MRIFVGCSTTHLVGKETKGENRITDDNLRETSSIAYLLVEKLREEKKHIILPWWEEETIPQNTDFFKRIEELSEICEFSIFIFSKENLKTNIDGLEKYGTNENVLIECGIFVGKNSYEQTFNIFEEGVDYISDFIKFNTKKHNFTVDKSNLVQKLHKSIKKQIEKTREINKNFTEYTLITNRETTEEMLKDDTIKKWGTKFLYMGRKAANLWGEIEDNEEYISSTFDENFGEFIEKLNIKNIDNLISFGPGIGKLDEIVVDKIDNNDFRYVPIDINPYLSMKALKKITQKGEFQKLYVPTAIVDDFEENTSDLKNYIKRNITKDKHKTLFLMMGGTFGNLKAPTKFLNVLNSWMDKDDLFLLDAYIMNNNYKFELDKKERLTNPILNNLIINAINKKRGLFNNNVISSKNIYEENIVNISKEKSKDGIKVLYKHTVNSKQHIILTSMRFQEDMLKNTLEKKFNIKKSNIIEVDSCISRAIYLLTKKKINDK